MAHRNKPSRNARPVRKGGVQILTCGDSTSSDSESNGTAYANETSVNKNAGEKNTSQGLASQQLARKLGTSLKSNGKFSGNNLFEALQDLSLDGSQGLDEVEKPKDNGRYNVHQMLERKGLKEPVTDFNMYGKAEENTHRKPRQGALKYNDGAGSLRSSRTWMSSDAQRMQDFLYIRNAMRRLFKHSEIAQWKYADYTKHCEAMVVSNKARLDRRVKMTEAAQSVHAPILDDKAKYTLEKWLPGTTNLEMEGNLGRILGEKTIWCHDWQNGKDEVSPWPSHLETKWEGDDRAKTGVGRFLPLPREVGPEGIHWAQLQRLEQYPLDEVARIPTMEDVYLPVDDIPEEQVLDFLQADVWEAIGAILET